MAISPWKQGATRPSWVVTVKKLDKSVLDITGATFAGRFRKRGTAVTKDATVGSYSITDATAGKFTYAPVAADVADSGNWEWLTTITISSQPYKVVIPIEFEETF